MADLVKFVPAVTAAPTVRLDLNDEASWWTAGFSAPPPRLRRSTSANSMSNGVHVSSSQYDARVLTLTLECIEDTQDAAAAQLQLLARELDRPDNLLMYQPDGASKPVFFRLMRSDMAQLADVLAQKAMRQFTVELLAEPFALGLRETLGPFTVTNDPHVRRNLVPNPSFEVDTSGWSARGDATIARVTTPTFSGAGSLRITINDAAGDDGAWTGLIAVAAGVTYTASHYSRTDGTARSVFTQIRWYDPAGLEITPASNGATVTQTAGAWVRSTATAAPPTNATQARVICLISTDETGDVHYIDAVMLEETPTALAYADGDTAGWEWGGTAHASASRSTTPAFDVTGVIGDVAAPAILVNTAAVVDSGVLAVRRRGTPSDLAYSVQAEACTLGTDTTNPGGGPDALMSGTGTNNFVTTSFATATMVTRLTLPALTGDAERVALRGRYRVLAVVRRSDATSVFRAQIVPDGADPSASVTLSTSTNRHAVDLGLVEFGALATRVGRHNDTDIPAHGGRFAVQAERVSGTGTLDWDVIFMIPADEQQVSWYGDMFASTDELVIDAENEAVYVTEAGVDPFASTSSLRLHSPAEASGGFPALAPGVTNRFYLLQTKATATGGEQMAVTDVATLTAHYWPRYLFVRPATS